MSRSVTKGTRDPVETRQEHYVGGRQGSGRSSDGRRCSPRTTCGVQRRCCRGADRTARRVNAITAGRRCYEHDGVALASGAAVVSIDEDGYDAFVRRCARCARAGEGIVRAAKGHQAITVRGRARTRRRTKGGARHRQPCCERRSRRRPELGPWSKSCRAGQVSLAGAGHDRHIVLFENGRPSKSAPEAARTSGQGHRVGVEIGPTAAGRHMWKCDLSAST